MKNIESTELGKKVTAFETQVSSRLQTEYGTGFHSAKVYGKGNNFLLVVRLENRDAKEFELLDNHLELPNAIAKRVQRHYK